MAKHRASFSIRQVGDALNKGLVHQRAGRLAEAWACYAAILRLQPAHADALHLSGVIARERGDLAASEHLISRAIQSHSSIAVFHYNLGLTRELLGKRDEAVASYRQAVALQPDCFEFHFNLAAALFQSGQLADAAESYRQVILLKPDEVDAHYSLGVVLQKIGDVKAASQAYIKALQIRPEFPNALSNLGYLCVDIGDLKAAEELLRRAVALEPGHVNAHCNLANLLVQQGNTAAALESCRAALALDPDHPLVLCNYGALCSEMGDPDAAERLLRRSIALDPSNVSAYCNLASVLAKVGNTDGAVEVSCKALAIDPKHNMTLCNLGAVLDTRGDQRGAIQCYQLALASHPDSKLAHFYLSLQRLAAGDFAAGWPEYEARWGTRDFRNTRPAHLPPQWRGEDIRGSRILIYSEQGLGDTLQFVRYVSMVAALGASVVLKVQPQLVRLLNTFDERITVVSTDSDEGAGFEWSCPLMSLPLAFRTELATIPADVPYLRADSIAADAWSHRLPARSLRVGLVWAGNPKHARDRQRSLALQQLGRLTRLQGVTFCSLQKGPVSRELDSTSLPIVDLSGHLHDFTDTAAIVANLDLVLCVDTAVAHLAAAMGKPVWLLVAHVSDWRWMTHRADTPWYPTMRLFRQTAVGKWDEVLEQVEQELQAMLDARPSHSFALTETCAVELQA